MPRFTIIFDASALNQLADHADVNSIISRLNSEFRIAITETNLAEIIATPGREKRVQLNGTIRSFLSSQFTQAILDPYTIIEKQFKRFTKLGKAFDWNQLDIRFQEAEQWFSSEDISDEASSAAQREDARASESEFRQTMQEIRSVFGIPRDDGSEVPSLESFVAKDGPFWTLCRIVLARDAQTISEELVRSFYAACPPFQAFVSAHFIALYDRTIRPLKAPRIAKAGRVDVLQSAYLPYCESFISFDKGQIDTFRIVEHSLGSVPVVIHWDDLPPRCFVWVALREC